MSKKLPIWVAATLIVLSILCGYVLGIILTKPNSYNSGYSEGYKMGYQEGFCQATADDLHQGFIYD